MGAAPRRRTRPWQSVAGVAERFLCRIDHDWLSYVIWVEQTEMSSCLSGQRSAQTPIDRIRVEKYARARNVRVEELHNAYVTIVASIVNQGGRCQTRLAGRSSRLPPSSTAPALCHNSVLQ